MLHFKILTICVCCGHCAFSALPHCFHWKSKVKLCCFVSQRLQFFLQVWFCCRGLHLRCVVSTARLGDKIRAEMLIIRDALDFPDFTSIPGSHQIPDITVCCCYWGHFATLYSFSNVEYPQCFNSTSMRDFRCPVVFVSCSLQRDSEDLLSFHVCVCNTWLWRCCVL